MTLLLNRIMTFTFTVVDEVITSKACGSWPRHRNRSKIICFVFSLSAGILKCYFRTFITPPFIWQYERLNGFKTSFLKLIFQTLKNHPPVAGLKLVLGGWRKTVLFGAAGWLHQEVTLHLVQSVPRDANFRPPSSFLKLRLVDRCRHLLRTFVEAHRADRQLKDFLQRRKQKFGSFSGFILNSLFSILSNPIGMGPIFI